MRHRRSVGPRKARFFAGFVTAALALVMAAAFVAPPAASALAASSPLNADVSILADDFEGSFPGTNWTVSDANPASGPDMWGSSTARAYGGSGSAWASASGNQTFNATVFTEDFENGSSSWTVGDSDVGYGYDYWGVSQYRNHTGNSSLWCAQVGNNAALGGAANTVYQKYDDYENASAVRDVNLTGFISVTLDYWYWVDLEAPSYDKLYAAYFTSSWTLYDVHVGRQAAAGWQHSMVDVPVNAKQVGFYFISDLGQEYEGAYVDDVQLYGVKATLNTVLRTYDTDENTTMSRGVSLSQYNSARMEYRYWLDSEAPNDTLQAGYFLGGNWTFVDNFTGSSGGWAFSVVAVPTNATLVGFRFISDSVGHREGAYLDDVHVWGTALSVVCAANVTELAGMEVVTLFHYSGGASQGLPPYVYSWQFGDGSSSALSNPTRAYAAVGNYTAALSVHDSLGQTCSAAAPTVSVGHDVSQVSASPATLTVVEGRFALVNGADGQGHAFALDWTLAPPACGSLDVATGVSVTFTASSDAGGFNCQLVGSVGPANVTVPITVLHDTSAITLDMASSTVPEGQSVLISAFDADGHALDFTWSATCGRVSRDTGPNVTFAALTTGGVSCSVKVSYGGDQTTVVLTVVHDTSTITVTPATVTMMEGASQAFTAVDVYSHPFNASWTAAPPSCGAFSVVDGTATTFTASTDAGGSVCVLAASSPTNAKSVNVTVTHDTRTLALAPASISLVEGGTQAYAVRDSYGHPFNVTWSLSPSSCGALSPGAGASTTLTLSADAGGGVCTVSAAPSAGNRLSAIVSVLHGPPASVNVTANPLEVQAGESVVLTGVVLDAAGHPLNGFAIAWAATCAQLSSPSGDSVSATLPQTAGGSTCTIGASHEGASGSATIAVVFHGPFAVSVSPASPTVSGGGTQVFTAKVTDFYGQEVPNATVEWSASCGALAPSTGPSTTFTAPSDLGGRACTVTASTPSGASSTPGSAAVATPMSILIPLALIVPVGAVVALLVVRKRRGPKADVAPAPAPPPRAPAQKAPDLLVTAPALPGAAAAGAAAAATIPCPTCGNPVETGWAACPECGLDLVWQ